MHRFFVDPTAFRAGQVFFPAEIARQMAQVLRLRPGQFVTALNNCGREYEVELEKVESREAVGKVVSEKAARGEPPAELVLYIGLCQREKFEWVLQKCTEAGAVAFMPLITSRSLVQDAGDVMKKYERWQRILQEAAEQCGRGRIPRLAEPLMLKTALAQPRQNGELRLTAWENENTRRIENTVRSWVGSSNRKDGRISILVGPEGGLSESEVEAASQAGFQPVSLGPRILRMETAAMAAVILTLSQVEGGESGL